ncbi:MAG: alpha/beta hydrolase [Solirubrobacteraceae bacterium]|jgi:pimeloyl-ACP methyl ester carboxylesterase
MRAADRRAVAAGTAAVALLALLALLVLARPAAGGPAPAPLRTARIDGATIGYRVLNPAARGTPLVLITGYGATMAEWDPAFVARLAAHRRVIMFDNRGMGNSTGPVGRLTVAVMARDAAELITALKLRHPDVLGWSMGGFIAQQLALDEPGLVHRLILASTDPGSPHTVPGRPSVIRVLTSPHSTPTTLLPILFPARAHAAGVTWLHAIAAQPGLTGADFSAPAATLAAQTIATTTDWLRAGDGTYARLPRLTAATLVASGADDVIVPPGNAQLLLRRLPHAIGMRVPGAGHAFLFQQPAAVAADFAGFLATGRVGHG